MSPSKCLPCLLIVGFCLAWATRVQAQAPAPSPSPAIVSAVSRAVQKVGPRARLQTFDPYATTVLNRLYYEVTALKDSMLTSLSTKPQLYYVNGTLSNKGLPPR